MKKTVLTCSPHIFAPLDTRGMMRGVITALIPAVAATLWFFRGKAAGVILASLAGCLISEYILRRLMKKKISLTDMSGVLTGLLLALVLPPGIPLWMAFLGGCFAVIFGKELFGGLGHNIFNPALLARAFLMAAFPVAMTSWSLPFTLDAVTTATPLGLAKFSGQMTAYTDLFFGTIPGSLGETSALALLIGGAYLFYKRIIDYRIPAAFLLTIAVFASLLRFAGLPGAITPLFHIMAGGTLLGSLFMATDPVTTPVTLKGRWVFGIGCGIITMTIRLWGGLPEGVMFSILLMNSFTPLINRITLPLRYGVKNGS